MAFDAKLRMRLDEEAIARRQSDRHCAAVIIIIVTKCVVDQQVPAIGVAGGRCGQVQVGPPAWRYVVVHGLAFGQQRGKDLGILVDCHGPWLLVWIVVVVLACLNWSNDQTKLA